MLKDKIENIKALVIRKGENDNKKTIENLAVFVVILIITIIAINMIWKKDNKSQLNKNINNSNKQLASSQDVQITKQEENDNMEEKLKNILSKIAGVGKVDVLITYSRTSQIMPLYNENNEESITEETDKEGGTRKINEKAMKKDIIYEEEGGQKTPITQSIVSPKIEGVIIAAQGANDASVKSNLVSAVEAVTGIGSHKIQVFELKD